MQQAEENASSSADPSALLSLLSRNLSFDEFAFHWLGVQCSSLPGVQAAVLLIRDSDSNVFKPVAKFPFNASVAVLAEIANGVIDEECGLLVPLEDEGLDSHAIAYPIHIDGALHGIVAIQVNASDPSILQSVMGQLQWSVGWVALYKKHQSLVSADSESIRSKRALEVLSKVQGQHEFSAACSALVTALASDLSCDRICIGFPNGTTIKVQSMSHTAQFGKNMSLLSAIGAAMEEAVVLGREVIFPEIDSTITAPDHARLLKDFEGQSLVTIPVYVGDRYYCVLTLERAQAFEVEEIDFVRAVGVLCAPTLEDKRISQRPLPYLVKDKSVTQLQRLFGADYIGRKVLAGIVTVVVLFFLLAKGTYRITADTELEGEVQRVIASPFNGYLLDASVRAGDVVKAGDLMTRLEDKELRLERQKWLSEHSRYRHEYNQAYAKSERTVVNINRARMQQSSAELALTEEKLLRSTIVAPFDGLVISGDLSQRLGGLVEQGEVLFELTPLNNYRVILYVEDDRISDVLAGQQGILVLSSLPNEKFDFQVTTITPVTEAREGANFFRVEAQLKDPDYLLRPGMQGVGKIEVDDRLLIGIWTRGLREWISLQLWKWIP